jgi:hypothetical protein
MGVALQARDAKADVLVFTRDRDREEARQTAIGEGILQATSAFSACPIIVGGVAIEAIEAWTLALVGERRSHRHARPKEHLAAAGITDQVAAIETADIHFPELDSPSLREWLDRARTALVTLPDAPLA